MTTAVETPRHRLTDEALLAAVGAGDTAALAELYGRYGAPAYRLASRIIGDDQLAEDAVQDAFIAAWQSASSFAPERGRAGSWLLMLVHRRAVDIVRRRVVAGTPHESYDAVVARADPGTEAALDAVGERDPIRQAVRGLPFVFRVPLALTFYADFTQQECAEHLGSPIGTVKSRTARALTRLRAELGEPPATAAANEG